MSSSSTQFHIYIFTAGLFAAYSILHAVFILSFVCYLPLFILVNSRLNYNSLKLGYIYGLGVSIVTFYWMVEGAKEFSGNTILYGVLLTGLFTIGFSLYWGCLIWSIQKLKSEGKYWWINALSISGVFVIAEYLRTVLFDQVPYFLFNSGYGLVNNLYTVQWVAFFGFSFLSFFVIFINYCLAHFIKGKNYKGLIYPFGIASLFIFGGVVILWNFRNKESPIRNFNIAILASNNPPQLKWDKYGGNTLAERLLNLNKIATSLKPDLSLWSECSIPWTYRVDDDFIREVIRVSSPARIFHLIGINSEYSQNKVFNSVYGLSPDGKVTGRYDKRYLLDYIETPKYGLNLNFYDLAGSFIQKGDAAYPIETNLGKAGIIICNEAVIPKASLSMVKNGADFLVNLSNDGWFDNSYITEIHFLHAKLSAVITRRDIVLNSNLGVSGYVNAAGEERLKRKSKEAFVEMVNISSSNFDNSSQYQPNIVIVLSIILIIFGFLSPNLFKRSSKNS